ncbi:hypothetical protein AC578_3252 [Pseudocercospora eumusae]|uniref:Uncharacterized protein n=1 Tax=Pseudocercospora eumusae TaxID=321146 RepID=A0A139H232_9PEZI|nr:hypothetical protein AC578_3252 [Pseudocercospora eumusae]
MSGFEIVHGLHGINAAKELADGCWAVQTADYDTDLAVKCLAQVNHFNQEPTRLISATTRITRGP